MIAGYAETNRTPFDLLEHEAEVISGYATEYSGLRWGLFFIGEYANMFVVSLLAALLFLGGFNDLGFIPGGLAIILKVMFFIFLFVWIRATWPHIRPDQLMWLEGADVAVLEGADAYRDYQYPGHRPGDPELRGGNETREAKL